jgi:hypothetical protein
MVSRFKETDNYLTRGLQNNSIRERYDKSAHSPPLSPLSSIAGIIARRGASSFWRFYQNPADSRSVYESASSAYDMHHIFKKKRKAGRKAVEKEVVMMQIICFT